MTQDYDVDAPKKIRVMTYNVHHGEGADGRIDLERIAQVIRKENPDIVALQELDVRTTRVNGADQLALLAELSAMNGVFGRAIEFGGGHYGVGVLSRWPIGAVENRPLPSSPDREARTALVAHVATPYGPLRVISTHLDHKSESDRARQASALRGFATGDDATVLAGDLNDLASSSSLKALFTDFLDAGAATNTPTYPAEKPDARIDFVLARPQQLWIVDEFRVVDESIASDHRPVVATLILK